MSKHKDQPSESDDIQALQQRVDFIMGDQPDQPNKPEPLAKTDQPSQAAPKIAEPDSAASAPIDIFSDPKTAPAVPKHLLELLKNTEPAAEENEAPESSEFIKPSTPSKHKPHVLAAPGAVASAQAASGEKVSKLIELKDFTADPKTDEAVDDIVAHEGDAVLAAEDAVRAAKAASNKASEFQKLRHIFGNKNIWLAVILLLVIVAGLPVTRFRLLGLVLKKNVSITVMDSKTIKPLSDAVINIDGTKIKTNANGLATFHIAVGAKTLTATKQYYLPDKQAIFVGLKNTTIAPIRLVATGRQVPITVLNKITGKPVAGATIKVLDTSAKTDSNGQALIVLPTKNVSDTASISSNGFNTLGTTVQLTSSVVAANMFSLTPAGHIYFLSNLSGTLDVIKTNLDGSGRQTVLKGTGKENINQTSLVASQDWKYVVVKASRDSAQPALYIIDTSSDKVTQFDSGTADFNIVGWYGHSFIYDVVRTGNPIYQAAREVIKSYAADSGQLNQLDSNQAEGTTGNYAEQGFYNFTITDGMLTYNTQWYPYASYGSYDLTGKNNTIRTVQLPGTSKKDLQNFDASGTGYIQAALIKPGTIDYGVYNYSDNKSTYYQLANGSVSPLTADDNTFNTSYPTYIFSPTNSQTFWAEQRDGKNSLFVGDASGGQSTQIASLSSYNPYGWYGSYLLVSKNSNELYIMPASTLTATQQPIKVSDYFHPSQAGFSGDGYEYGSF